MRRRSAKTAEGNLQTARGTYQQVVGYLPPGDLVEPQPLALPIRRMNRTPTTLAANNNPVVIAALFNDAAAKDAVDVAFAQLMPQVSFQGRCSSQNNSFGAQLAVERLSGGRAAFGADLSGRRRILRRASGEAAEQQTAGRSTMPAAPRCRTRCSRGRRWSPRSASANSTREAIRANQVALEGVEREAIVGSRTTLDVLNAQQALLNSQTSRWCRTWRSLVTASYQVAAAVGRLTARDLHLPVAAV